MNDTIKLFGILVAIAIGGVVLWYRYDKSEQTVRQPPAYVSESAPVSAKSGQPKGRQSVDEPKEAAPVGSDESMCNKCLSLASSSHYI